jgi:hypothetical protein
MSDEAPSEPPASETPTAVDSNFDLKTARWKHQLDECIAPQAKESYRQRAERMLRTPYVVSIAVFFIALAILLVLRPPMVHTPGKRDMERGNLSVIRLIIWSAVAALLALFVPMLWNRRKG